MLIIGYINLSIFRLRNELLLNFFFFFCFYPNNLLNQSSMFIKNPCSVHLLSEQKLVWHSKLLLHWLSPGNWAFNALSISQYFVDVLMPIGRQVLLSKQPSHAISSPA